MGLRALVGVENANGTYRARSVQTDGCPTVIVPVLSTLVHDVHGHDLADAVAYLMSTDWWRLSLLPAPPERGGDVLADPLDSGAAVHTGRLDAAIAGDFQWAYLIRQDQLRVYLAVHAEADARRWEPWGSWPVRALPDMAFGLLLDVQRCGYARQWQAQDHLRYLDAVRERFGQVTA